MKLIGIAFALGLIVLVIWFMVRIERPGPNVGELDGLAILRLLDGQQNPAEYCLRRGLNNATGPERKAMERLVQGYGGYSQPARDMLARTFFAVPPSHAKQHEQVQQFLGALQKNRNLVIEPAFRPQLVLIAEFMAQQCRQLAQANMQAP